MTLQFCPSLQHSCKFDEPLHFPVSLLLIPMLSIIKLTSLCSGCEDADMCNRNISHFATKITAKDNTRQVLLFITKVELCWSNVVVEHKNSHSLTNTFLQQNTPAEWLKHVHNIQDKSIPTAERIKVSLALFILQHQISTVTYAVA